MHPILRDRYRLGLYLAAWLLFGALLALVLGREEGYGLRSRSLVAVPLCALYAFICLAAWYPTRAQPLGRATLSRILTVHLVGALLSSALWQAGALGWALFIDRIDPTVRAAQLYRENGGLFFAVGVLLYLLAVATHYLLLAAESSRRAASRELELRLLAQQAELEAFKAQIDPHFLFNSLNSISSLCGSDPEAARRTAVRLGELLRASLRLGSAERIPLARELDLAQAYLDVESARYGDRLEVETELEPESLERSVPALVLQPLLENALKHGIAHLLEGGVISVRSGVVGERLHLVVSNPCDPDRPATSGAGIGLENVRGRLRLLYGDEAVMNVRDEGNSFEVTLVLPGEGSEA